MRLAEELVVLLADSGELPRRTLRYALAGAVLLDLALERRIDTDPGRLWAVDTMPLDDDLLDPTLAEIAASDTASPETWMRHVARGGDALYDRAVARLAALGVLEIDDGGVATVKHSRLSSEGLAPVGAGSGAEVKLQAYAQILAVLFQEGALPSPREACLIALMHTCGMFRLLLTPEQYEHVRARIELFARLELTGQAITAALRTMTAAEALEELRSVKAKRGGGWPIADGHLPLLGHALRLRGDLCAYFVEQYRNHGPVFEVRAPGRRFVVLAGQEANRLVGREGSAFFRMSPQWKGYAEEVGTSHLVLALDGTRHRTLRRTLRRGFSGKYASERVGTMVDIVRQYLDERADGCVVTVGELLREIALEQLAVVTTGTSARPYWRDIAVYTQALMDAHIAKRMPAVLVMGPKVRRARRRLDGFMLELLRSHERERPEEEWDLIDDVLDLHRNDPEFMGHTDLFVNVLAPFFAGIDTVGSTIPMALYDLLSHPDALARVRREADAAFADGPLTGDSIAGMVDTRHAVMETLRIHPVASMLSPRFVTNSFTLGGYRIVYGSMALAASAVTHFLPEHFPDPYEYDIDRYAEPRREHVQAGAYVPYGLGHHTCLAQRFAEIQSVATLAALVHHAELEMIPPGYRLQVDYSPSPRPSRSFRVRIHRRAVQGLSGAPS